MAAPPSKKQKLDNVRPPIVFQYPGQPKPDVRLTVFDQEFHVSSVMLKLNSAFFRKFLDSPDKAVDKGGSNTGSLLFKYDWITQVDEDGQNWFLVCNNDKNRCTDAPQSAGRTEKEITWFNLLLCAVHCRPYILRHPIDLFRLVDLADYYCALPAVSRTIDGVLLNSPVFCEYIEQDASEIISAATKIRSKVLFRECFIWMLTPYHEPQYLGLKDQKLLKLFRYAHGCISTKVATITAEALSEVATPKSNSGSFSSTQLVNLFKDVEGRGSDRERRRISYPQFIRSLKNEGKMFKTFEQIQYVDSLLDSRLVLDRDHQRSGEECCKEEFLCAEIDDEDLPWDAEELDW